MSKYAERIAELSPDQRVLLEAQLQKKRRASISEQGGYNRSLSPASPRNKDEENLVFAATRESVEDLLGEFYGRFPWPWQPMTFSSLADPNFGTVMLNQDFGRWGHDLIPAEPRIWVAGCGTNQALLTAMRFPNARVIGSDVSTKSLEVCANNSRQMGVDNLELREESINQIEYKEEFDYIICTGVIHHNADPQATLHQLASALKPSGVMELMVYNRFHRAMTSAFQKAIRILGESRDSVDFESDLATARKIAKHLPVSNQLSAFLDQLRDSPESDFADLLIQPVEHSYTVESLEEMAAGCGLEIALPCATLYAAYRWPTIFWNMEFGDDELQSAYEAIPDTRRWQITNLLLQEKSSLLWFYLTRADCGRIRKAEKDICSEFLDRRFARTETEQITYVRDRDGAYTLSPERLSFPAAPPHRSVKEIFDAANESVTMREVFRRLNVEPNFTTVNQARVYLTTTAFPYLKAITE